METLTGISINDIKKILIRALYHRVKNTSNEANGAGATNINFCEGLMGEVFVKIQNFQNFQ